MLSPLPKSWLPNSGIRLVNPLMLLPDDALPVNAIPICAADAAGVLSLSAGHVDAVSVINVGIKLPATGVNCGFDKVCFQGCIRSVFSYAVIESVRLVLTEIPALATSASPAINCNDDNVDIRQPYYPMNTLTEPCAIAVQPAKVSPTLAAGRPLINTVADPLEIVAV